MADSPKAVLVKDLIKSDKVVIFSKTYCPYCKLAKEVSYFDIQMKFNFCFIKSKVGYRKFFNHKYHN